jgi:hypothetical protein
MVLMGFESLNRKNLERMNKSANIAVGEYDRAVANIYKHGMLIMPHSYWVMMRIPQRAFRKSLILQ